MKTATKAIEVFRPIGEPRFELGATIPVKEGVSGIVLARFNPSKRRDEVGYIVEPQKTDSPQLVLVVGEAK